MGGDVLSSTADPLVDLEKQMVNCTSELSSRAVTLEHSLSISHARVLTQDIVIPTIRDLREFLGAWQPFIKKFHLILVQVVFTRHFP